MKSHLFYDGQVEVGNGKPGYDWVPAYAQALENGGKSQMLTRSHWQKIGKRDGFKCVFHDKEKDARAALAKEMGAA